MSLQGGRATCGLPSCALGPGHWDATGDPAMLGGVEVAAERFADQFACCRALGLGTGEKLLS